MCSHTHTQIAVRRRAGACFPSKCEQKTVGDTQREEREREREEREALLWGEPLFEHVAFRLTWENKAEG